MSVKQLECPAFLQCGIGHYIALACEATRDLERAKHLVTSALYALALTFMRALDVPLSALLHISRWDWAEVLPCLEKGALEIGEGLVLVTTIAFDAIRSPFCSITALSKYRDIAQPVSIDRASVACQATAAQAAENSRATQTSFAGVSKEAQTDPLVLFSPIFSVDGSTPAYLRRDSALEKQEGLIDQALEELRNSPRSSPRSSEPSPRELLE